MRCRLHENIILADVTYLRIGAEFYKTFKEDIPRINPSKFDQNPVIAKRMICQ